ncbi:uncharacterized protein LOC110943488 [Helianthus annuus]|uniref:uncharacterized protein LOC110943488 n=1 Tax=Helianthus annuus TaxID=4232 RepID=UPI000B903FAE|nr:uncharacterized protein LOC110943488 [Helianthus annuus]
MSVNTPQQESDERDANLCEGFVTPDLNSNVPVCEEGGDDVEGLEHDGHGSHIGSVKEKVTINVEAEKTISLGRTLGVEEIEDFAPDVQEVLRTEGNSGKADLVRGLRIRHEVSFIMIQETQFVDMGLVDVALFWGRGEFCFEWVPSAGRSGGLLSIWDPKVFSMAGVTKLRNRLLVSGSIKGCGSVNHLLNVYAPHNIVAKRVLWDAIGDLIGEGVGLWTVAGDFNAVRSECERRNSIYNASEANEFNDFLDAKNLQEYSLKGRRFTFVAGDKLSRIDRIFVNWEFFMTWPNAEYIALAREGFANVVRNAVCEDVFDGEPDLVLLRKFKKLKRVIASWIEQCKQKEDGEKQILQKELTILDEVMEERQITEVEVWVLEETKRRLREIESCHQRDLKQKA